MHLDPLNGTVGTPPVVTIDTGWGVVGVRGTTLILRHWLGKGQD